MRELKERKLGFNIKSIVSTILFTLCMCIGGCLCKPLHVNAQVVVPNVYYQDVSISTSNRSFTLPSSIPSDANIVGVYWSYLSAGGDTGYKCWVGEGEAYVSISGRTVNYHYREENSDTDWISGTVAVVWTNAGDSTLSYSTGRLSINGKFDSRTPVVYGSQSTNKLAFMYSGSSVPGASPKGGGEDCSARQYISVGSNWVQLIYSSSNSRKYSGGGNVIVFYSPTQPTASVNYNTAWTKGNVPITFTRTYDGTGVSSTLDWFAYLGADSSATPVWEGKGTLNIPRTITNNGTYYYKVRDNTLNEYLYSFTISNIDRTAPAGSISSSNTSLSTDPITLTCSASDSQSGLNTSAYSWMRSQVYEKYVNGEYTPVWSTQKTFTASVNDVYYCLVRDVAGNIRPVSLTVENLLGFKTQPSNVNIDEYETAEFVCTFNPQADTILWETSEDGTTWQDVTTLTGNGLDNLYTISGLGTNTVKLKIDSVRYKLNGNKFRCTCSYNGTTLTSNIVTLGVTDISDVCVEGEKVWTIKVGDSVVDVLYCKGHRVKI